VELPAQVTAGPGLIRTRQIFGWLFARSVDWLLAHVSAAVLRSTAESSGQ
jgi:hypothetical protein